MPVVLETFTFLERNTRREVALAWKDSLSDVRGLQILTCGPSDLKQVWSFFGRRDLHRLSAMDASSIAVMKRAKIRCAFAFDHHFAAVGFRMAG